MTDLQNLTTEQLAQHRVDVLTECERRRNLAAIPEQVRDLAVSYKEGGGDPAVLEHAISGDADEPAPGG